MLGTRLLIGGSHHLLNYLHLLEIMKVIFFRNLRAFTDKSLALLVCHLFWMLHPSMFFQGFFTPFWTAVAPMHLSLPSDCQSLVSHRQTKVASVTVAV